MVSYMCNFLVWFDTCSILYPIFYVLEIIGRVFKIKLQTYFGIKQTQPHFLDSQSWKCRLPSVYLVVAILVDSYPLLLLYRESKYVRVGVVLRTLGDKHIPPGVPVKITLPFCRVVPFDRYEMR